jgi:hypothetical protein
MREHDCGGKDEPGAHIFIDFDEVWAGDIIDQWTAAGITFQLCYSCTVGWDMFWIAEDAQEELAREIVSKNHRGPGEEAASTPEMVELQEQLAEKLRELEAHQEPEDRPQSAKEVRALIDRIERIEQGLPLAD